MKRRKKLARDGDWEQHNVTHDRLNPPKKTLITVDKESDVGVDLFEQYSCLLTA